MFAVLTIALALVGSIALGAQASTQQAPPATPAQQTPTPTDRTAPAQQVTVVGCVQRESDYRAKEDAGRGGVAGTGVGVANEFVLTSATSSGAASMEYELTGPDEGKVSQYVGKRVEIAGMLKPAETTATGTTGGATAGRPPTGIDIASKDLKLRELEVTSVREASGMCPSTQK